MMSPHWLDNVFQTPMSVAALTRDEVINKLVATPNFQDAITKAQTAYNDRQTFIQQHPDVNGASPSQAARTAFLATLNQP